MNLPANNAGVIDDYHARPLDPSVASKSGLDQIARSPAHYFHWCHEESPETPALAFGKALHVAVLEPDKFDRAYIAAPYFGDGRTKAAKEAKAEFLETKAAGRIVIDSDDYEVLRRMADSIHAHPLARNLVVAGIPESRIDWIDPETGLRCKARIDYRIPEMRFAIDLKSTDNAHPSAFARSVASYRYHVQEAMYRSGLACSGSPIDHFAFIAIEKTAPFLASVCYLDDAAIERGGDLMRRDMATLKRCVDANEWPGYSADLSQVSLPAWAFYD